MSFFFNSCIVFLVALKGCILLFLRVMIHLSLSSFYVNIYTFYILESKQFIFTRAGSGCSGGSK